MLNENQLKLLRHLSRFNLLDYPSCLDRLNNDGGSDRTALSYAFRLLTKNRYVSKDKRGCVSILAKGRALFPELEPLLSAGGGEQTKAEDHGGIPHGGADGEERYPRLCGPAGMGGPLFYPVRLLAEDCAGYPLHHALYRNADGRKAPSGRL